MKKDYLDSGFSAHELVERYMARHYAPIPVDIREANGVWLKTKNGRKLFDAVSGYSSVSHGHKHPRIVRRAAEHILSNAPDMLPGGVEHIWKGLLVKKLAELCKMERTVLMNTGAEAVETAIKISRKWGYEVKGGIPRDKAEIIVCPSNFHGRTLGALAFSTEDQYRNGFGPFMPGVVWVQYGNIRALERAITPNTVAFIVELIQGEGGILDPPLGYFSRARDMCAENNVLFVADEIQTGLGRTGKMFCCEHEDIRPDMYILGKALGAGLVATSAVVSTDAIMDVLTPGDHGSTFGGNPLACDIALESLDVIIEEYFPDRAATMGEYLVARFRELVEPLGVVREIRGKGLLRGVEFTKESGIDGAALCKVMLHHQVLAKDAHGALRISPPIVVTNGEIEFFLKHTMNAIREMMI